jgi:hypothetical protein
LFDFGRYVLQWQITEVETSGPGFGRNGDASPDFVRDVVSFGMLPDTAHARRFLTSCSATPLAPPLEKAFHP